MPLNYFAAPYFQTVFNAEPVAPLIDSIALSLTMASVGVTSLSAVALVAVAGGLAGLIAMVSQVLVSSSGSTVQMSTTSATVELEVLKADVTIR